MKKEEKIARICWNDFNWIKPSGREGKTTNIKSYEYINGFGHEEWLFDLDKIVKGYHYSFIEPVFKNLSLYLGKSFNISLYSINHITKERWWIGRIEDVIVIDEQESKYIYTKYKGNGWLDEMTQQIQDVGIDNNKFNPSNLFCIKFKPINVSLLETPKMVANNDNAITATYYVLLNKKTEPKLIDNSFVFSPGHKHKKPRLKMSIKESTRIVNAKEAKMVDISYEQLISKYGASNVGTEQNLGYGTKVDLVVKDGRNTIFYEFKASNILKEGIRDALSQLLEYAYYPNTCLANKLIIVTPNKITLEAQQYFTYLRDKFKIPIYYRRFNFEHDILEDTEY